MLNNNDINNFRDILKSAENIVSDWGGKLYFVQLPMWARYYGGNKEEKNDLYNIIINEVNKLEIPIIDIHKIGFSNLYDPLSYYNRRRANGHYNSKGYKLVSDLIIDRLMKDGLIH